MLYNDYGLHEALAIASPIDPDVVSASLDLFRGNPVPALRTNGVWRPAPKTTRRTAYRAHLAGVARAGSYPFQGVGLGCGCSPGAHTCEGRGTDYVCMDLDDHHGRGGMASRVRRTLGVVRQLGLKELTFTSKSGTGAHVFVFLDGPVTTQAAHAAGNAILKRACAGSECDVLPSPAHASGYGTLHALPLNPNDRERGGGLLLDGNLRVVPYEETSKRMLHAHYSRSSRFKFLSVLGDVEDGAYPEVGRQAVAPGAKVLRQSLTSCPIEMRLYCPRCTARIRNSCGR